MENPEEENYEGFLVQGYKKIAYCSLMFPFALILDS